MLEFSLDAGWGFGRTSSWKDGKVIRIEESLGQMIATVPIAGEHLRKQRLEREAAERRREEHEALRRRLHSVQWEEEEAAKSLIAQAEASREAAMIREYVERMRAKFVDETESEPPESLPEDLWLRWAAIHADSIDPLGDGSWPWQRQTFQRMKSLFPGEPESGQ